jgi:hypothetical protein
MTQLTQSTHSTSQRSIRSLDLENRSSLDSAFDLVCINLICNLESLMADFRQKQMGERIENAAATANSLLLNLLEFSDEHFEDEQASLVQEQIRATMERRDEHNLALRKRSWGFAIKSLISSKAIDPISIEAYDKLGKSLISTCGLVFTEMQRLVRSDSQVRSQIEQSAITFLEELKGSWL